MPQLSTGSESSKKVVLATIANQKDPTQVVEIVHLAEKAIFVTRGLTAYFKVKEIAVPQNLMLSEINEISRVLSWLLERIATAGDLNLSFRYEPEFEVNNRRYSLQESGDYMVLTRND
ncbi:MAG: hypothetical protein ACLFVT_00150 [Syntrophobacteria bacterium]